MIDKKKYIDIRGAAKLVNRSESTIRNLIGGLKGVDRQKYLIKEGRKVWILKSFLTQNYEIVESDDKTILALIETFRNELEAKNRQIESMGDFQEKLIDFLMSLGLTKNEIQEKVETYRIDKK